MTSTSARTAPASPSSSFEGPIARMLRRALLQVARPISTTQDRLDLAELAEEVGRTDIAEVARLAASLRQGCPEATEGKEASHAIERAVSELKSLMAPAPTPPPIVVAPAHDPIAACRSLAALLAAPLDADGEAALAGLLAGWRDLATMPDASETRVDADLPTLLSGFARRELLDFLRRNHDLAYGTCGSARLLHRTARLGQGALGPYLTQIGNVVRSGRDILGLITLAAGDDALAEIDTWVVPLATHLRAEDAAELVDELADLGLLRAVANLLDAAVSRTDRGALLPRLRDALLDLGERTTALRAQRRLVELTPLDAAEWCRLGDLLASENETDEAAAAFDHAFRIAPTDDKIAAHRAAWRNGTFDEFVVTQGFATPRMRQLTRLTRRAA